MRWQLRAVVEPFGGFRKNFERRCNHAELLFARDDSVGLALRSFFGTATVAEASLVASTVTYSTSAAFALVLALARPLRASTSPSSRS